MTLHLRQRLLASTLLIGVAGLATPAWAQTTPPPIDESATDDPAQTTDTTGPIEGQTATEISADGNQDVEDQGDIVVTGTRIPSPNLNSVSPVTTINSQEIKLQGTTRTEDLINSLPQVFADQGSNVSNGATGTANVNLRGLGAARTLVLINGRRLLPGDPRSPFADINFVPASVIRRVDVLTGGASSVYGADAVAGVVNFIMDTTFEGLRLDGQYSVFDHTNNGRSDAREAIAARNFALPSGHTVVGGTYDVSATIGAGFDDNRGHVTAYATYRKQRAVRQAEYDYSACALTGISQTAATTNNRLFNCGGSATSANGTFFTNFDVLQVGTGRNFIPGSTPFNFAPFNFYQRPDERYTFGVFANYEVDDAVKPYLEAMFMDDRSVAQIAPSGNFGNTIDINCDNPLLSASQRAQVCVPGNFITGPGFETDPAAPPQVFTNPNGTTSNRAILQPLRRNVEGGGRRDDLQHTDYRIVAGVRGDIAKGLSYDAYYQYGRVVFAQTYFNDFSVSRLGRALDVITGANGQPVCRSVADGSDPNCVPYDIFAPGQVTQAALDYLQTPGFSRGINSEQVANASITALLGEYGLRSPLATNGAGLNFGVEYRKETLDFTTDTAFTTGDLAGQGGPTIGLAGEFDVKEVFGEIRVPLVEDGFFNLLAVGAGYRYSKYDNGVNSFSTNTYKFEVDFAPIRDVRIRASYNRAARAPNIVDLFSAQSIGLAGSFDPCAGAAVGGLVNGFTAAQCANTGVTAAQFGNITVNPADQYNGLLGGNPNLDPEEATTKALGVVVQPRFLPGFAFTADYFDIKVRDVIGTLPVDTTLTQCVTTGDPFFCSLIQRDQFGSLFRTPNGFTVATNLNVGRLETRGIDVSASYSQRLGSLGSLGFSLVGTYLDKLVSEPLEGVRFDCKGFFGSQCGTPNPKWRHKLRLTYTSPIGIGLSGQWRHFDSVRNDASSSDDDLAGTVLPGNARLAARDYFDLTLTARVGDRYNFRLGANNIFDTDPPIAGGQVIPAGFGNGNTFPQVYDALGRYLFAGVTLNY